MLVQLYRNWKEQRAKRKALAKQLFTLLNGTLLFDGPSGHMVAMCGSKFDQFPSDDSNNHIIVSLVV